MSSELTSLVSLSKRRRVSWLYRHCCLLWEEHMAQILGILPFADVIIWQGSSLGPCQMPGESR